MRGKKLAEWKRCSRYNPKRFSVMSRIEMREFARNVSSDGFPLSDQERTMFERCLIDAIDWALKRDKEYEARRRCEALLAEERRRYEQQRLQEARKAHTPDIVIHL